MKNKKPQKRKKIEDKKKLIELKNFVICFFFFIYFICLFMAVLGLRFCVRAFSSCGKWGHSSSRCAGLSLSQPLVAEHRLQTRRLSNCGSRAQLLHGMWDPPRPGHEPMSPALAGRLPTTVPPGKPCNLFLNHQKVKRYSQGTEPLEQNGEPRNKAMHV